MHRSPKRPLSAGPRGLFKVFLVIVVTGLLTMIWIATSWLRSIDRNHVEREASSKVVLKEPPTAAPTPTPKRARNTTGLPTYHEPHHAAVCKQIMRSWQQQAPTDTDDLRAAMRYTPPPFPSREQQQRQETKGVVLYSGGERLAMALLVVRFIRKVLHSTLPVEIWYLADEVTVDGWPEMVARQKDDNVFLMQIPDDCHYKHFHWENRWTDEKGPVLGDKQGMVMLKPLVVALSSFQEVLYLDDDCFPAIPPEEFFSFLQPPQTAVFFSDLWSLVEASPIWKVLQYPSQLHVSIHNAAYSQDSGVFVVCKTCAENKGWASLLRAGYLNYHHKTYYPAIYKLKKVTKYMRAAIGAGDKDTFQIGWMMGNDSFVRHGPVVLLGRENETCGGVMGQTGPDGKVVAFHLTLHKLRYHDRDVNWKLWGDMHIGLQRILPRSPRYIPGDGISRRDVLWNDGSRGHAACLSWWEAPESRPNTDFPPSYESDLLVAADEVYSSDSTVKYITVLRERSEIKK
eukprot:TRINITY_DN1136_c0_g1_i1.p1 TRINITY_DN1136_c0_g1~~TRINITY_DN1136_c0_g1_i1.p1  ORF type:complete len:513 (+),score=98.19 TRINITY_DN1136_c0_g1_i1:57-1595(+)